MIQIQLSKMSFLFSTPRNCALYCYRSFRLIKKSQLKKNLRKLLWLQKYFTFLHINWMFFTQLCMSVSAVLFTESEISSLTFNEWQFKRRMPNFWRWKVCKLLDRTACKKRILSYNAVRSMASTLDASSMLL